MTKRTTTTARLCRFRKETERQRRHVQPGDKTAFLCPWRRAKRGKPARRATRRGRAQTPTTTWGARRGGGGSSCCGSRRRHAHIACGACCRGPFTNTCEPTVPLPPSLDYTRVPSPLRAEECTRKAFSFLGRRTTTRIVRASVVSFHKQKRGRNQKKNQNQRHQEDNIGGNKNWRAADVPATTAAAAGVSFYFHKNFARVHSPVRAYSWRCFFICVVYPRSGNALGW